MRHSSTTQYKFTLENIAKILIWSGLAIVIVALGMFWFFDIIMNIPEAISYERVGQFGEFVGGIVGSLWTLAGVILFYEALKFQRSELENQRQELRLQREDIIVQTNQFIRQNETLENQKLENTFFRMLTLHTGIINSIEVERIHYDFAPFDPQKENKQLKDRDCFVEFYNCFKKIYTDNVDLIGIADLNQRDMVDLIKESFNRFYVMHQTHLGHYFRNLFYLIKFIDDSKTLDQSFYTDMIQAHLSNHELVLIFYYCNTENGTNFKGYIEKYSMLANLPDHDLMDMRHKDLYESTAFGTSN